MDRLLALTVWSGSSPSLSPTIWLAPLAVAFLLAVVLTPVAIWAANRFGIIDKPIGMKLHKRATPLLGGTAVYAAFVIVALIFVPFQGAVRGVIFGGAVAVIVGIVDDRYKLPPIAHLAGQLLAAIVAVTTGLGYIRTVHVPFISAAHVAQGHGSLTLVPILGIALTLFWIVGMMNTVNFLDGLDGLSSGVGIIGAGALTIWSLNPLNDQKGHLLISLNHASAVLAVILCGSLGGFLLFNWSPAKIFIGDSGAMFVGFALGVLSIFGIIKLGTALVIVSIPVLDVAWAILRRSLRRKSFLAGDKQHIYHRMMALGMSPQAVVLSLYAIVIALAAIDLKVFQHYTWIRLTALGVIGVVAIIGFASLEIAASKRKASTAVPVDGPAAEALPTAANAGRG